MKRAIQLGLLLLCAVSAFGQNPTCSTWVNDTSIHIPSNYPGCPGGVCPGINGTYTDATGCQPKQITDVSQNGGNGVSDLYNLVNAESADKLYVIGIMRSHGAYQIFRKSDSQVVVPLGNIPGNIQSVRWAGGIGTGSIGPSTPVADGHTLYILEDTGTNTTLSAYTFTDTGCAPSCTMTKHLLHTFLGYTGQGSSGTGFGAQEFSGGEADTSDDGDHTVFDDDAGGAAIHQVLTTYTFSTDTVVRAWDYTAHAGTGGLNGAIMTHTNKVLVNWNANTSPNLHCIPSNVDCFAGGELYDNGLNFIVALAPFGSHRTSTWDGTNEFYTSLDNNTQYCSPSNLNGLLTIDFATQTPICRMLLSGTTNAGGVSGRNEWVVMYLQDFRGLGGNPTNGTEITSVNNASAGSTIYNSIPGGFLGMGIVGLEVDIPATGYPGTSFSNSANNGRFLVTAQSGSGTHATMNNASGIAETANVSFQGEATNTYPILPGWASNWRAYENECVAYNIITNNFYRLVQTRTFPAAQVDYWKESFCTLNRQGDEIVYNTDYGINSTVSFTNLMVLPFLTGTGAGTSMAPGFVSLPGFIAK